MNEETKNKLIEAANRLVMGIGTHSEDENSCRGCEGMRLGFKVIELLASVEDSIICKG
jgi:hypothetical protein